MPNNTEAKIDLQKLSEELYANMASQAKVKGDAAVYPHGEGSLSVGSLIWNLTKSVFNNTCGMEPEVMNFLVPLVSSVNNCYSAQMQPIFHTDPNIGDQVIIDFINIQKTVKGELTRAWKAETEPCEDVLSQAVQQYATWMETYVYNYKDFKALQPEVQIEVKKRAANTLFVQECTSWWLGEKNNNPDRAARAFYTLGFIVNNQPDGRGILLRDASTIYKAVCDACSGKIDGKLPELQTPNQVSTALATRIAEHLFAAFGLIMVQGASKNKLYYEEIEQSLREANPDIRYPFKGSQWDAVNPLFLNYPQEHLSSYWNDGEYCTIPMQMLLSQVNLNYIALSLEGKAIGDNTALDINPAESEVSLLTPMRNAYYGMLLASMFACRQQRAFYNQRDFIDQINQWGSLLNNDEVPTQFITDLVPKFFANYGAWGKDWSTHLLKGLRSSLLLAYHATKHMIGPEFKMNAYKAFGFIQEPTYSEQTDREIWFSQSLTELQNNTVLSKTSANAPVNIIKKSWPVVEARKVLTDFLIDVNTSIYSDAADGAQRVRAEVYTQYAPGRFETKYSPTAVKSALRRLNLVLDNSGQQIFEDSAWRSKIMLSLLQANIRWLDQHYQPSQQELLDPLKTNPDQLHSEEKKREKDVAVFGEEIDQIRDMLTIMQQELAVLENLYPSKPQATVADATSDTNVSMAELVAGK